MLWPPVRIFRAALGTVSLLLFTAVLGWGYADRNRPAPPPPEAVTHPPAPEPKAYQPPPARSSTFSPRRAATVARPKTSAPSAGPSAKPGTAHLVRRGDTLIGIASLYGVQIEAIRAANQMQGDLIREGERLAIPGVGPLRRHRVAQGDSMWEVATRYGISIEDLLVANGAVNPGHLQIGQELVIPHTSGVAQAVAAAPASYDLSLGGQFAWPVVAPVSSYFGPRWGRNHNGIDLAANHGDAVRASRTGEVLLAGTVPGYGLTIVLQHNDGTRTLYAHCSRLLVKAGDRVTQGDLIARVGSSGMSTGPHLHFEIIVNNRPIDPLIYLPTTTTR